MTTIDCRKSSWLRRVEYVRLAPQFRDALGPVSGFLIIETDHGRYAHPVPFWVPGLVAAARSKGKAYNALVRHKYPGVRLET